MSQRTPYLLAAPASGLIALAVGPLVALLVEACAVPNEFVAVTGPDGRKVIAFTVLFAAVVATLTMSLAFPVALFIDALPPSRRRLALGLILVPKCASVLVVLFGLQQLLAADGAVNRMLIGVQLVSDPIRLNRNLAGAIIGEVYLFLPYAVLVLVIQLGRIDPALTAAARGLGASRRATFRRVTLPLCLPGLRLAALLSLSWGMGAFLGPQLLGSPAETTLSVEAHVQRFEYSRDARAAATAVVLVVVTVIVLLVFSRIVRGKP